MTQSHSEPPRKPRSIQEAMADVQAFLTKRNDNSIAQESASMRFKASLMEFEAIAMVNGDLMTLRERSHMLLDGLLDAIQSEHALTRDIRDKMEGGG